MSNFSSLYDAIATRIGIVLPSHLRLPNPYAVDQNSELWLKQGWGMSLGPASNTFRELSCRVSIKRDLVVSISRQFLALEDDFANKVLVEKQLIEDQILLIRDFCDNTALPSALGVVEYQSDGGIEQIFSEKDNFLVLKSIFSVEYFETI